MQTSVKAHKQCCSALAKLHHTVLNIPILSKSSISTFLWLYISILKPNLSEDFGLTKNKTNLKWIWNFHQKVVFVRMFKNISGQKRSFRTVWTWRGVSFLLLVFKPKGCNLQRIVRCDFLSSNVRRTAVILLGYCPCKKPILKFSSMSLKRRHRRLQNC